MDKSIVNKILQEPIMEAWEIILTQMWQVMSAPISKSNAESKIIERDRIIGEFDNLISGSSWELWHGISESQIKTSTMLIKYWASSLDGKAILILDALSLRETPWLKEEASKRGYEIEINRATFSEIPGDTTPFAKALGFGQRSSLADNGGKSVFFPDAFTETVDLPFIDCASLVKPEKGIIFWHQWPDSAIHAEAEAGDGARKITKAVVDRLTSESFWMFVDKLTTGRSLVITGDHGYADAGLFHPINDKDQSDYMKSLFKSGRSAPMSEVNMHCWVPPLTLNENDHILVLGRRKWKSPGGYPTLVHGGLSLLEVTVPYIQIRKKRLG